MRKRIRYEICILRNTVLFCFNTNTNQRKRAPVYQREETSKKVFLSDHKYVFFKKNIMEFHNKTKLFSVKVVILENISLLNYACQTVWAIHFYFKHHAQTLKSIFFRTVYIF